ncbi:MAG: SCO family protein [Rhodoferax sp.]|nr:SCO family protein [Rhodoferax sp.]MCW5627672.1 SCO family protein [Rhodoferax sp.]
MTCLRVAMALALTLLATAVAAQGSGAAATALDPTSALRDSQAAIGRDMSRHQLLDTRGKPVRLGDFAGKPLLVSFIYTGCFQVCPTTTKSLSEAVDQLAEVFGEGSFNVVSIGFNQPFDSPAAMRAFAAQMRVDRPNWKFLSPPPATVDALTADFGFRYVATPAGFDHMLTVSVLDAKGRIATQVYGERLTRDQLGEPLRLMLRDAPMPESMQLADLIERVRILCTVYDPETGTYRYDYALFIEIAGGLTFALAMAWFFLDEWRNRRRRQRKAERAMRALDGTPG